MKRFIGVLLALAMIISLTGCGSYAMVGDYAGINLQDTVEIPENGIIEKSLIEQIKNENAIGSFSGVSNGINYEWTIFGSDIEEAKEVNLAVELENMGEKGVKIAFSQAEPFAFAALLSIYLNDTWDAQSATAYQQDKAVYSVSLTGSKESILNLSVREVLGECVIRPDAPIEQKPPEAVQQPISSETQQTQQSQQAQSNSGENYLSPVTQTSIRVYSDGGATGQDQYLTDPVPAGKPLPVEPENVQVDTARSYTCIFSIECSTILNNLSMLDPSKLEMVPSDGVILPATSVTFYEGESVYDVLQRVCRDNGIHMEASWTPIYNSAYVEGIHNLYEFDCGNLSGWMYRVDGWYPNYGCSRYQLKDGETVEWRYTCDLGYDVGAKGLF